VEYKFRRDIGIEERKLGGKEIIELVDRWVAGEIN
jgi:hypothetical protein